MANYKIKEVYESLDRLENHKYSNYSLEWCINRIDWLWRFRHITREQMEELSDRVVKLLEKGV